MPVPKSDQEIGDVTNITDCYGKNSKPEKEECKVTGTFNNTNNCSYVAAS